MTADAYIRTLRKKNPGLLSAERISIRVTELERIVRIAYHDGAADALEDLAVAGDSKMPSFMQDFFGGLKAKG